MELKKSTLRKSAWLGLLFLGLAFIFVSELQVTQSTTIVFGDEGYWGNFGRWTADTLTLPTTGDVYSGGTDQYTGFHTDAYFHPLLSASFFILGGETLVKASSPLLGLVASLFMFIFVRRIYGLEAGVLSSIMFAAIPSLITHSILLYVDVLFTLLTMGSLYFLYRGLKEKVDRYLIVSGILGGAAVFTKETGFILPLIYFIGVWLYRSGDLQKDLRKLLLVGGVFTLMFIPWFGIHNFAQFGVANIPFISAESVVEYTGPSSVSGTSFTGLNTGGGTESGILRMGILSYTDFAYGTVIGFTALIGLALMAQRRRPEDILLGVFAVLMLIVPLKFGASRAENAARFTLPAVIGIAAAAGVFSSDLYDRFRQYGSIGGKLLGITFIVALSFTILTSADAKAESLTSIKQFPDGFYEGCDWIRENTAEDAQFMTLWASGSRYHCQRDFFWNWLPDFNDIILGDADLTYERLNAHGIDYIYIQKFSISNNQVVETYPVEFVRKLQDTDRYEVVYENDDVIVVRVK